MKSEKRKMPPNKNLNLLLAGRFVTDTGTRMQYTILPLYILDLGGSSATMGTFSMLTLLPLFILLPFGGVIADRLNRKKIMVNSDLISGFIILILGILTWRGHTTLIVLIIMQMMVNVVAAFFESSSGGMVPTLVSRDDLGTANSKVATIRTLAALIGPVIGAGLYAMVGAVMVFLLNGVTFLLSAFSEMFITYQHEQKETKNRFRGIVDDLAVGIKFVRTHQTIRPMSLFYFFMMTLTGPIFMIVLPLLFRKKLDYSDSWYGLLQSFQVSGSLAGVVIVGLISKKLTMQKSFGIGNKALLFALLSLSLVLFPTVYGTLGNNSIAYFLLLAFVLLFLSLVYSFMGIPVQTIIQQATPEEYMSRVFSILGLISKGSMPVGAFLLGLIIHRIELHWTMIGVLILMAPAILITNIRLRE